MTYEPTTHLTFAVRIFDKARLLATAESLPDYDPNVDTPLLAVIQSNIAPLDAGFEIISIMEKAE